MINGCDILFFAKPNRTPWKPKIYPLCRRRECQVELFEAQDPHYGRCSRPRTVLCQNITTARCAVLSKHVIDSGEHGAKKERQRRQLDLLKVITFFNKQFDQCRDQCIERAFSFDSEPLQRYQRRHYRGLGPTFSMGLFLPNSTTPLNHQMQYVRPMRSSSLVLTACAFVFTMNVAAESRPSDTYNTIVVRNPFGLKDPPPPVVNTNPPAAPPKKEDFYLTGISTIGNPKRPKAYLLAKDASKKDYDQKFYSLNIGDRQGDVTLQEIDPKGRRVKIEYLGEEKWLSMKDNGVPAPAGGGPGPNGGPMQPGMIAPPGGMPAPVPLPLPQVGGPGAQPVSYPNSGNMRRTVRTTGANMSGTYNGAAYPGALPTYAAPNVNVPGTPGAMTGNPSAPAVPPGPQTDTEVAEQIIRMQAENAFKQKQGIITPPVPTF